MVHQEESQTICVVHCFSMSFIYTLLETNSSHLKMDGWNTFSFPFRKVTFQGLNVSFREGIYVYIYILYLYIQSRLNTALQWTLRGG